LDNDIWGKIKSGEYKGLSFGGATKAERQPIRMKDGSIAYTLGDLEHYEVAVCADPAVPLALITDYNPLAKASTMAEDLGNGKMLIKCDKYGCYVNKDADLTEEDTFDGKVSKLVADGKTKEQAEKIVGSFVKGEQGTTSEGNSDSEMDGNHHSMYNQDVNEDGSSGRRNVAVKEEWQGTGAPQPKEVKDEEDDKDKKKDLQQPDGGLRGLGGYNTSQQGADDIAQVSEVKEKDINEENYIKNENQESDSNMANELEKKPEEEVKAEIVDEEPKVEKTEEEVEDKNKAFDAISVQLKAIIDGQKSLGDRIKALETPTDLPLVPKVSDKDDIGAEVKAPDTYQSNSRQAGLDDDKSGEKKPEGDKGNLAMQEKALVNKASHTFTTETPRPNAALETIEKSSGKDYSPILKDARANGFEGLSQVAQNILAGKYYTPTSDEVGTY
jgi:hypothetical protein